MRKFTLCSIFGILIFALAISFLATGQELEPSDEATSSLSDKSISTDKIISYVDQLAKSDSKEKSLQELDRIHSAVTKARAELRGLMFMKEGRGTERLLDPFYLPDGAYRIHLEPKSSPVSVSVSIFHANGEDTYKGLLASEQVHVTGVFNSPGKKYMIKYDSDVDFKFWFEKLN